MLELKENVYLCLWEKERERHRDSEVWSGGGGGRGVCFPARRNE